MKTDKWEDLEVKLSDSIMETIKELKFTTMTPVQVGSFILLVFYTSTNLKFKF